MVILYLSQIQIFQLFIHILVHGCPSASFVLGMKVKVIIVNFHSCSTSFSQNGSRIIQQFSELVGKHLFMCGILSKQINDKETFTLVVPYQRLTMLNKDFHGRFDTSRHLNLSIDLSPEAWYGTPHLCK